MSLFHGLLLFDIAEPPIGPWHEDLGGRGYVEIWRKEGTEEVIYIEPYEGDEWEAWWADEKGGAWDTIAFGPYEEVKKEAKRFMERRGK